jgi:phosphoribosylformylglycinamidine cyclo-ligase
MPDLINGFDLAAMSIGVLDKDKAITGKAVEAGDVILGLESSGIHSNGLTLARKVLIPRFGLKSNVEELGGTLGEELLKPTRIYVKPVLSILKGCKVHGLGHITGGSFTKLRRLNPNRGFRIDWLPEPKPIFQLIKRYGKVEDREMYRTFNMGVGFCVIAPEDAAEDVITITRKHGVACWRIGSIVKKPGVIVKNVRIA